MYAHMKALGCDEIAALASEKLQVTMQIIQTDKLMSVWQQSQLGMVHRTLYLDRATPEKSSQGDRSVTVEVKATEMIVKTTFEHGCLVDTRTVREENDQEVLNSELMLSMDGVGPLKTTRIYRKLGEPNKEVTQAPDDLVATQCGLSIWNTHKSSGHMETRRSKS